MDNKINSRAVYYIGLAIEIASKSYKKIFGKAIRKGEVGEGDAFFGIVFSHFFSLADGMPATNGELMNGVEAFRLEEVQNVLCSYSKTGKIAIAAS